MKTHVAITIGFAAACDNFDRWDVSSAAFRHCRLDRAAFSLHFHYLQEL